MSGRQYYYKGKVSLLARGIKSDQAFYASTVIKCSWNEEKSVNKPLFKK
jgi:hypothetical protein